jgi:hypothetical protein
MLSALNVLNRENTERQVLNIRRHLNIRGVVGHWDRGFDSRSGVGSIAMISIVRCDKQISEIGVLLSCGCYAI